MNSDKSFFKVLFRGINILRLIIINIVFFVLLFFTLALLASISSYNEQKTLSNIEYGTILKIAPKSIIKEKADEWMWVENLLSDEDKYEPTLFELTNAIKEAGVDERIEGLYLDLSYMRGISSGHLPELKEALLKFKESKKPIWVYSTYYNTSDYYLASFADVIGLDPMGGLSINAFSSYGLYFKGMEEKFGVKFQTFHAGECKGGVETFSRENMSDEVRENIGSTLRSLWDSYLKDVSENRGQTSEILVNFVKEPYEMFEKYEGNAAKMALGESLVSTLCTEEEFEDKMCKELSYNEDETLHFLSYKHYLPHLKHTEKAQQIGLIHLSGAITGSKSRSRSGDIAVASEMELLFERAIFNPAIRAIVLRVDSGGGEVFASEVIRRSVQKAREKGKPVVVSMGSVAASGAYWISSQASYIFASPFTITGSIGVYAVSPNLHSLLKEKLGITSDGVSVLEDAKNPLEPLDAEDEKKMNLSIGATYNTFLQTVVSGRGMDLKDVAPIAEGKIYSGLVAKDLGLVDEIGTFSDALQKAASLADISDFSVVEVKSEQSAMNQFMNSVFSMKTEIEPLTILKNVYELLSLKDERGIYVYTPTRLMWQK